MRHRLARQRSRAGWLRAHVEKGFPDSTKSELIRLTVRGIRRTYGNPQRRVAPLTIEHLAAIISVLGNSKRDIRDCAILLVGFAGALRRSELSRIQCNWISRTERATLITVPKSKTDQEGRGRSVSIPLVSGPICPTAALNAWLEVSRITEGAIFRRVSKSDRVLERALSASAIAAVVKRRAVQIGLDPMRLSGHSLRAGFTTGAAIAGLPVWRIKLQTGHASDTALGAYIREAGPLDGFAGVFQAGRSSG
jgi:integrase